MRIIVDVNHPGHVHYFKNFIREMRKRGHEVLITASEKDVSYKLLDIYGLDYVKLGSYGKSLVTKMLSLPLLELKMYRAVKSFDPEVFVGFGSIRCSHISKLMGKKSVIFDDTEHAIEIQMLYAPFSDVIITPTFFKKDLGRKHVTYDGYSQLAHTHPNYFKPDPGVLNELGLTEDDIIIVIRLVSWSATHDVGHHGIMDKVKVVKELEKFGRVFISAECELEKELEKYRLGISPDKLHDLLYYSTLYYGEGGTTAIESALLGTHAIHVSTTAKYCGVFDDLSSYGLLWISEDTEESLELAKRLLSDKGLKKDGKEKLKKLLNDKIDVTKFMTWFVENYPESYEQMRSGPDVQYAFRGGGS
jgi:predicted glycosyltransferase